MIEGVTIANPRDLQARGGIYNASITDKKSPIVWVRDRLAIYFNQAPVFR